MGSKVFITATDTDAGKTWITASAIRTLLKEGRDAKALKPIACGVDDKGQYTDIETLQAAQRLHATNQINLYRFSMAAAPSQAAANEGRQIDPQQLVAWCNEMSSDGEITLIEGVGGLMVPLTDTWLVSDWIQALPDAEVWLVVACRLGAINQALLSLDKLKMMGRLPDRIIFNATNQAADAWVKPVADAVTPFIPESCKVDQMRFCHQLAS